MKTIGQLVTWICIIVMVFALMDAAFTFITGRPPLVELRTT